MNKLQKLGVAATAAALSLPVFATGPVDDVTAAITTNMASATSIVVLAGLALVGLSFTMFILRKGRRAASGKI